MKDLGLGFVVSGGKQSATDDALSPEFCAVSADVCAFAYSAESRLWKLIHPKGHPERFEQARQTRHERLDGVDKE